MWNKILWYTLGLLSGLLVGGLVYKEIYFWHLHLVQTQYQVSVLNEHRIIQCQTVNEVRTMRPILQCIMAINGDPGT